MDSLIATWMDRRYLEFRERVTPDEHNDELQFFADTGISHEASFVKELESQVSEHCLIKGTTGKPC